MMEPMMQPRPFGRNHDLEVSPLGLGASHVGDDDVSEGEAEKFLNAALDMGITLVDTARGYGMSEERIGKYIAHRRSEFVLSTKGGYGVEGLSDWTPECITRGVERALGMMRTDHIDIFHLHSCDQKTLEHDGVAEALVAMVEAGKVRVAAYSGENEARAWAIRSGLFTGIQSSLNICDQKILEGDLPEVNRRGIGFIAKRPIANAFWRHESRPTGNYCEDYWVRARTMGIQPPEGMEWDEFALRYTLHQPGVSAAIAGTKNLARLRRNVEIAGKDPLDASVVEGVRKLFREHGGDWAGLV
ncbi:MAG: aldo/keto reductase [Candidatus Sumerlaeia bacterium]|nr:aldo/keto reductase [Candidatus Sumerlaeia bacterium]